jgi:hypothetical protein
MADVSDQVMNCHAATKRPNAMMNILSHRTEIDRAHFDPYRAPTTLPTSTGIAAIQSMCLLPCRRLPP